MSASVPILLSHAVSSSGTTSFTFVPTTIPAAARHLALLIRHTTSGTVVPPSTVTGLGLTWALDNSQVLANTPLTGMSLWRTTGTANSTSLVFTWAVAITDCQYVLADIGPTGIAVLQSVVNTAFTSSLTVTLAALQATSGVVAFFAQTGPSQHTGTPDAGSTQLIGITFSGSPIACYYRTDAGDNTPSYNNDSGSANIGGIALEIAPIHAALSETVTISEALAVKFRAKALTQTETVTITESVATPTRFYLPLSLSSLSSVVANGTWGYTTGASVRVLARKKTNTTINYGSNIGPWTPGQTALDSRFVSAPLAAQTISGTLKCYVQCKELSSSYNVYSRFEAYVVSKDGTTVRGTLLAIGQWGIVTEFNLNSKCVVLSGTVVNPVTLLDGDRIVACIGYSDLSGTTPQALTAFGDQTAASDLIENESQVSNANPWVQFSQYLLPYTGNQVALTESVAISETVASWFNAKVTALWDAVRIFEAVTQPTFQVVLRGGGGTFDIKFVNFSNYVSALSETLSISESLVTRYHAVALLAETAVITETMTQRFAVRVPLGETLVLSEAASVKAAGFQHFVDSVSLTEILGSLAGSHVGVAGSNTLGESVNGLAKYRASVAEAVGISETEVSISRFRASFAEAVSLSEQLQARFGFKVAFSESLVISEHLAQMFGSHAQVSEGVAIGEGLAAALRAHVVLADFVALADAADFTFGGLLGPGVAAGVGGAVATLSCSRKLVGAGVSVGTARGTLTDLDTLAGALTASGPAQAVLTESLRFVASSLGTGSAVGAFSDSLRGRSTGLGAAVGAMTEVRGFASSLEALSYADGELVLAQVLEGAITADAVVVASLDLLRDLGSGQAQGAAQVVGTLEAVVEIKFIGDVEVSVGTWSAVLATRPVWTAEVATDAWVTQILVTSAGGRMQMTCEDKTRITLSVGEDAVLTFLVKDKASNLVDLTGAKVYFTAKVRFENLDRVVQKRSLNAGGSDLQAFVPDQVLKKGQYQVFLDSADTRGTKPTTEAPYPYDSWVVDGANKSRPTIRRGELVLEAALTTLP